MAGFEPAIPANERPQAYALDRSGTGIGIRIFEDYMNIKIIEKSNSHLTENTGHILYKNNEIIPVQGQTNT
jgi:hypothetical protein